MDNRDYPFDGPPLNVIGPTTQQTRSGGLTAGSGLTVRVQQPQRCGGDLTP